MADVGDQLLLDLVDLLETGDGRLLVGERLGQRVLGTQPFGDVLTRGDVTDQLSGLTGDLADPQGGGALGAVAVQERPVAALAARGLGEDDGLVGRRDTVVTGVPGDLRLAVEHGGAAAQHLLGAVAQGPLRPGAVVRDAAVLVGRDEQRLGGGVDEPLDRGGGPVCPRGGREELLHRQRERHDQVARRTDEQVDQRGAGLGRPAFGGGGDRAAPRERQAVGEHADEEQLHVRLTPGGPDRRPAQRREDQERHRQRVLGHEDDQRRGQDQHPLDHQLGRSGRRGASERGDHQRQHDQLGGERRQEGDPQRGQGVLGVQEREHGQRSHDGTERRREGRNHVVADRVHEVDVQPAGLTSGQRPPRQQGRQRHREAGRDGHGGRQLVAEAERRADHDGLQREHLPHPPRSGHEEQRDREAERRPAAVAGAVQAAQRQGDGLQQEQQDELEPTVGQQDAFSSNETLRLDYERCGTWLAGFSETGTLDP